MTKRSWITIGVIGALALAVVAGFLVSQGQGGALVSTTRVTTTDLAVTISANGSVKPDRVIGVFSPLTGRLNSVAVSEGVRVKRGDRLASLETGPLRVAVRAADSAVAAARALPTATDRLRQARTAAIRSAEAARGLARQNLSAATITAPASGTIHLTTGPAGSEAGAVTAMRGAGVAAGQSLFSIIEDSRLRFFALVDEADIAALKTGQPAKVSLDSHPGQELAGTVRQLRTLAIQTETGGIAFPVVINLPTNRPTLRVGMSGSVTIETRSITGAVVLPISAVRAQDDKNVVFAVGADDRLTQTWVSLGASTDTLVQITAGITAGTPVVIGQLDGLKDGDHVRVQ